jgi:hypothetical protein
MPPGGMRGFSRAAFLLGECAPYWRALAAGRSDWTAAAHVGRGGAP